MKLRRSIFLFLIVFFLTSLACNLPISAQPTPTMIPPPPTSPPPPDTPTAEPTLPPLPSPSEVPTATPISSNLYLPVGVATNPTGGNRVTFFNLQGQLLGELQTSDFGTGTSQQVFIAGPITLSPGLQLPPLVYFTFQNSGELRLNSNNNVTTLVAAPNFNTIIGIPGHDLMIYTNFEYQDNALRSIMYMGNLQSLPTAQPILDNSNTESWAIKPIAISVNQDQPVGVWYTTIPIGIGGDIVFEPRKTLNYLDLTHNQILTYLDMTNGPVGLSGDQIWFAYTPVGSGPMSIVHNFDFSNAITFPLLADSDRGSGDAVFSPDNQYVAWKEGSGTVMGETPTFHATIRIATTTGNILTELTDSSLLSTTGFQSIGWIVPVGWLDGQTLVLEVRDVNWDNACVLRVNYDGSGLAFLAQGSFIGFVYP